MTPRRGSIVAGAISAKNFFVDPSTLSSADGLVVQDGDDPALPMVSCDAVDLAGALVIQEEVYIAIPDAVASMCNDDPDDVSQNIQCDDALVIPAMVVLVPVIPGHIGL